MHESPAALLVSAIVELLGRVERCWKVQLKATRDSMHACSGTRLVLTVLTTESVPAAAFSTVLPLQSFVRPKSGVPRPVQRVCEAPPRQVCGKQGWRCL